VQIRGKKFEFLGLGGPRAKSATLFRVSVQPAAARRIAFVLLGVGSRAGAFETIGRAAVADEIDDVRSFGHAPVSACSGFD
jgi:hypothetical protein